MSHAGNAPSEQTSRRDFLKTGTAAVLAGAFASSLSVEKSVYAAGSDVLKIGLIGCGGRGTGAALQALTADPNTRLTAVADTFADRVSAKLGELKNSPAADRVTVDADHQFVGFDGYKKVIDSGVDVVLLATPPHFRPAHLKAAVDAGKHCFVEKPVAVDAPGVRSILATCEQAKAKGLSIVSGLCWRYDYGMRDTFKQIHDGGVGDIVAIQASYNTQELWMHPRKPEWSDMEWQVRNWLYFTWLSGDFNNEQHVHSLDKVAWAMKDETPIKATGIGGRQVRTGPEYGNIYDHFSVVYEYANGVKAFTSCRQQAGTTTDVSDHVMGTKGVCDVFKHRIKGEREWKYTGPKNNMYQTEHDEFFASIRSGKPINNGEYMAKSTMMAILGRMSAYTGKALTWEQAFNSKEDLTPAKYEWGPIPTPAIAMPGLTEFA
ncbi:MAG TPA: Gfo/Idh/MocA family oxidoreductase [Planctomycetaceae bacterium]|nr:Gfo/Idh/MocA family oxidoreductase [Planctomycetaceae bacterium]